jgi:hypothetical protein
MKRPELLIGGYRVVHCKRFRAMAIVVHDNSMKTSSQARPLETLLSIGLMETFDSHVSVGPSNGTGAAGSGNTGIVFADVETMEVKQNHLSNSSPQTKKVRVPWNKGKRHSPETIAKIKERTAMAMQTPQVRALMTTYESVTTTTSFYIIAPGGQKNSLLKLSRLSEF